MGQQTRSAVVVQVLWCEAGASWLADCYTRLQEGQSDSLKHVAAAFLRETNWSSWQTGSFLLSQPFTEQERRHLQCWTLENYILLMFPCILFFLSSCLKRIFYCPLVSLYFSSFLHICLFPQCLSCSSVYILIASSTLISSLSCSICLFMSLSLFKISGMQSCGAEGKWLIFLVAEFV